MMRRWNSPSIKAFTTWATEPSQLARENYSFTVGDLAQSASNRLELESAAAIPIQWLTQVHGVALHLLHDQSNIAVRPRADAAFTQCTRIGLAILTADCMPIVIADQKGSAVAVAHAGWRGLAAGVIEATLDAFTARGFVGSQLQAFIAPCIGPKAFEVGAEVREEFLHFSTASERDQISHCFAPSPVQGRYLADLTRISLTRFARFGMHDVLGPSACTFSDPLRFYSHRYWSQHPDLATGQGRQATVAWLAPVADGVSAALGYQKYN